MNFATDIIFVLHLFNFDLFQLVLGLLIYNLICKLIFYIVYLPVTSINFPAGFFIYDFEILNHLGLVLPDNNWSLFSRIISVFMKSQSIQ